MAIDKIVIAPGGPRPESQTHWVAPGHSLDASSGRYVERDAAGKVVKDHGPVAADGGRPPSPTTGPGRPGERGPR